MLEVDMMKTTNKEKRKHMEADKIKQFFQMSHEADKLLAAADGNPEILEDPKNMAFIATYESLRNEYTAYMQEVNSREASEEKEDDKITSMNVQEAFAYVVAAIQGFFACGAGNPKHAKLMEKALKVLKETFDKVETPTKEN